MAGFPGSAQVNKLAEVTLTSPTHLDQTKTGFRRLMVIISMIALVSAGLVLNTALPAKASVVAGADWIGRQAAAANAWSSVAWGGAAGHETYVAVAFNGTGKRVMTSPDGFTWTSQAASVDNNWQSVVWGGPDNDRKFVAVAASGTGNRVMTSPDGITWTSRTSATDNDWRSVTWGNGEFVAVADSGTGNRVMTSPDGITWTSRTSAADQAWKSVTWGGDKFVAVASNSDGYVMTSSNGIAWSLQTIEAGSGWFSVTWGGLTGEKKFVAVAVSASGGKGRVATSPDGVTWTTHTGLNAQWTSVAWGGTVGQEIFVAVANGKVMTSSNGVDWAFATTPASYTWSSVTVGGPAKSQSFVVVSYSQIDDGVLTSGASYTLGYNANGADSGTVPTDSGGPYVSGTKVTVAGNTGGLAKAGSTFTGWNTAADGSGTQYADGDTFPIYANMVLYAQWASPDQTPGKPRKLAVTGGPSAKTHKVHWKASKHATSQTRYIVRVKLNGTSKILIRKTTKALKVTLTRKQLLRATFGTRGDVRSTLVYRIQVNAETAGKSSSTATTFLRVSR